MKCRKSGMNGLDNRLNRTGEGSLPVLHRRFTWLIQNLALTPRV